MGYVTKERLTELGIERLCRECEDWWPLDFFTKSNKCKHGRRPVCKTCRNEYKKSLRRPL